MLLTSYVMLIVVRNRVRRLRSAYGLPGTVQPAGGPQRGGGQLRLLSGRLQCRAGAAGQGRTSGAWL